MTVNETFDVIVQTPLGDKDGSCEVHVDGSHLFCALTMMGHTNTFDDGHIDEDGNLDFEGKIWTPFGAIASTTTGTLKDGKIDAITSCRIGKFKIVTK